MYQKITMKDMSERMEVGVTKQRWNRQKNGYGKEAASIPNEKELEEEAETEMKIRNVYNHEEKDMDMRRLRVTDMRNMPRTMMPPPRPNGEEAEIHVRRETWKNEARMYINKECKDDGTQKTRNMSEEQSKGLKETMEEVKDGKIMIGQSDKGKELTVSSMDSAE